MPQPVSNTLTVVSGSLLANKISYVVDGQNRNYRGGFGGLSWMSEAEATNNVIFIGNTSTIGRGPADKPLFYPSFNTSDANIIYAANTLPGSPRNFTTVAGAYGWAANNNFFINSANSPIPRIDADGLALYLDASQPTSYPQTNNDWFDLSGLGNNGTLINGTSWNSRGYFEFDGTDDRVQLSNALITGTGDFTVSAFVQKNTTGTNVDFIVGNYGVGNNGLELYYYNDKVYFYATNIYIFSNSTINDTRWHYIAGVRSGGVGYIYIDGNLDSSASLNVNIPGNNPFTIGNGYDYNSEALNGSISEVLVYPTKALTQTEVKQNYFQSNIVTDGLVFMLDANNLVSYPRSGTTWYNLTGSSGNALLYNGPTYSTQNGGGISRDNTDDFISASISVSSTTNYSVETWFKANPNQGTNYNALISAWNYPIGAGGWEFQFYSGLLGVHPTYTVSYTPNTIAHAVYTQNGTETKIYLNGVLQQTSTTSGVTLNNGSIGIGNLSAPGYGGYNLESTFYNVRLYNKTLSASEVQQNYNETKYRFQGQQIVTNGLVLNLDSANKDSYPGTGTTWTNLSGGGYNGTLVNGPSFLPNQNGGIFDFDGTDDYVSYPSLLNVGNTFTVNFWIKPTSKTRQTIVSDGYPYLANKGFFIACPGNNATELFISLGNDQKYTTSNIGALTTGVWQMVTARVNGASELMKLYVNGIETSYQAQMDANITVQYDAGVFTTGIRDGSVGSDILNSDIGVLQIYNRALSVTEITQNYNAQKTRFGL